MSILRRILEEASNQTLTNEPLLAIFDLDSTLFDLTLRMVRIVEKKRGAHITYLTGRDVPRMRVGTVKTLAAQGFPVDGPGVEVILKPKADMDDARFKVDYMKTLLPQYKRIWLFENEPVNLNLAAKELPDVQLVFIDSCHSGREEVAETLDRITHFEVTLDEMESESPT
ncbi:MAG: hypothetical protein EOP05_02635 [Proteobacteria bacterium]|nr:MAG: hypothetical protein EOP05_02635 [Pseudomonadota bacterium]